MKVRSQVKKLLFFLCSLGLVFFGLGSSPIDAAHAEADFDLAIGLKAPQHVAAGSNAVINLSYSNIGTAESPVDTTIQATLPAGLSFVSAADQDGNDLPPVVDGPLLTWEVGALPAGSCCLHVWITTLVAADLAEGTALTTEAEIRTGTAETNLTNNTASVTSEVCDMAGSKKVADVEQARPGDVVTYTITISLASRPAEGPGRVRNVDLIDSLPAKTQARFLGWVEQPSGALYDEQQHQLRWQGSIGDGASLVFRYRLGIEGDFPPGQLLKNQARLQWSGGGMDLDPVEIPVMMSADEHMFGPEGGQWQHAYGLTLTVPPNSVQEMTRFQFRAMTGTPTETPPGWVFAQRAFELNAYQFGEIHQFNQPVEITIRYNRGDVSGIYQNSLRLWYREGPGEPWAMLGEPVQHRYGEITFTTDHFTEFALFGQPGYQVMIPLVQH